MMQPIASYMAVMSLYRRSQQISGSWYGPSPILILKGSRTKSEVHWPYNSEQQVWRSLMHLWLTLPGLFSDWVGCKLRSKELWMEPQEWNQTSLYGLCCSQNVPLLTASHVVEGSLGEGNLSFKKISALAFSLFVFPPFPSAKSVWNVHWFFLSSSILPMVFHIHPDLGNLLTSWTSQGHQPPPDEVQSQWQLRKSHWPWWAGLLQGFLVKLEMRLYEGGGGEGGWH